MFSVVKCGTIWGDVAPILFLFVLEKISMGRPKKNGTYLNICIETPIYERLEALCEDAGQTKTIAVERALTAYLDNYEERQKRLKELEGNGVQ